MAPRIFLGDDFLLDTQVAQDLYERYAADAPIVDFHCHLSPERIADNRPFADLTEAWLAGDHYKWRAMRAAGVSEHFCTGDAPSREKFQKWAATVPKLLRNPLYHWTHLELRRVFDIDALLKPATADDIWERTNQQLQEPAFRPRELMQRAGVEVVCTTDDPTADLRHHAELAEDEHRFRVLPTWRPDAAYTLAPDGGLNEWIDALGAVTDTSIGSYATLMEALDKRHAEFHAAGCRLADHGLTRLPIERYSAKDVEAAFDAIRSGQSVDDAARARFRSAVLHDLCVMNHRRGWAQQVHLGALRNCSTRLHTWIGPDAGFDAIGDDQHGRALVTFLTRLDDGKQLARTILYNINPRDFATFASIAGSFNDGSMAGKVQLGAAWWFLDQLDGMTRQIETVSQIGLLSQFVGMVTDSRSFLSFVRHEYFRRLLCNILGDDIHRGRLPNDEQLVGELVQDICHRNARRMLGLG